MRRKPLFLVSLLALAAAAPALEVPYLAGRVNDLADLLSPGAEERIERELVALEQETGAQGAVLTVPGLEGDPLEDFSLRVVDTWKLGRQGVDDGVLLVIARDERQVRIEVGYGLEATLTDVGTKRILSNLVTPRFREGDFDGGVEAAVGAIAGAVRGQEDAIPLAAAPEAGPTGAEVIAFAGLFILVIGLFSLVAASAPAAGAWLLYVFLMPFYLAFPAAALGLTAGLVSLGAWVVGFPILRRLLRGTNLARFFGSGRGGGWRSGGGRSRGGWMRGAGSRSGWGGFGGGGFSGGGFGGGGFGGGGFGGGGSFGGGGASGSW